jgi:hypothetical protein
VQAHLVLRPAEGEALDLPGREEAGDAARARCGAGEERVAVGPAAVGDPGLGAGDAIPVGHSLGLAGERRGVRARLRLGEAVGAHHLAGEHVRQPALLLLGGAERRERVAGEPVHAHRDGDGGPARRELLEYLQVDLVRLGSATVLLGVGQAQQAGRAERGEEPLGVGLGPLVLLDARRELLVGELAGESEQVLGLGGGQHALDGHDRSSYRY